MRLVPESYKRRFFRKAADAELWQAMPAADARWSPSASTTCWTRSRDGPFDLVFLKNVLIYFAPESKRRVMDNVRSAIRPGGLLVAGPAEGIGDLVKDFVRLRAVAVPTAAAMKWKRTMSDSRPEHPRTNCSTACWATSSTSRTSS